MNAQVMFGILTIIIFFASFVWGYFQICKKTKSRFVRGLAIFVFSLIIAMSLASIYIVWQTQGRQGLRYYFIGAGEALKKGISESQ